MINHTLEHPYIALMFISSGILSYIIFELVNSIRVITKYDIIGFFTDFIAVLLCGSIFYLISYTFANGQIRVGFILSYILGILIVAIPFGKKIKNLVLRFAKGLRHKLKKRMVICNNYFSKIHNNMVRRYNARSQNRKFNGRKNKNKILFSKRKKAKQIKHSRALYSRDIPQRKISYDRNRSITPILH